MCTRVHTHTLRAPTVPCDSLLHHLLGAEISRAGRTHGLISLSTKPTKGKVDVYAGGAVVHWQTQL